MSKQTKHTPGPWEIHINKIGGKHIEILHPLINTEDDEYKGTIGGYHIVVGNKNCQQGYILEKANANLIASAPIMYEALKILVSQYEESGDFTMGGRLTNDGFLKGKAAINMAEGK